METEQLKDKEVYISTFCYYFKEAEILSGFSPIA
jgi:hypothetical protein